MEDMKQILREGAELPALRQHVRLRLRRVEQDAQVLSDAVLRAVPGVAVQQAVYVGGVRVGAVREADERPLPQPPDQRQRRAPCRRLITERAVKEPVRGVAERVDADIA